MVYEYEYDIDSLIETFEAHSKEFILQMKERREKYPDATIPQGYDFNLPTAFITILSEIKALKKFLNNSVDKINI